MVKQLHTSLQAQIDEKRRQGYRRGAKRSYSPETEHAIKVAYADREQGHTFRSLANQYGLSISTIARILRGAAVGLAVLLLSVDGWGADRETPVELNWRPVPSDARGVLRARRALIRDGAITLLSMRDGRVSVLIRQGENFCFGASPEHEPSSVACGRETGYYQFTRSPDSTSLVWIEVVP